jgi:hypothetical protein
VVWPLIPAQCVRGGNGCSAQRRSGGGRGCGEQEQDRDRDQGEGVGGGDSVQARSVAYGSGPFPLQGSGTALNSIGNETPYNPKAGLNSYVVLPGRISIGDTLEVVSPVS